MRAHSKLARQLHREGRVAALVFSESFAVEPHGSAPIARAHDEEDASPPGCGHGDFACIPSDVAPPAVRHAGQRRTPGERHDDLARARQRSTRPAAALTVVGWIKRESPTPVEIQPLGALKVGTGMFGERDLDRGEQQQEQRVHGALDYRTPAAAQLVARVLAEAQPLPPYRLVTATTVTAAATVVTTMPRIRHFDSGSRSAGT